jgi:hypothetical protein
MAVANEKASEDLNAVLEKWFSKHLVKGIKLPVLRALHGAGAFNAFSERLAEHSEADVIGILRKVDPNRTEILSGTRAQMESHLRDLAASVIDPAPKPKPAKKPKAPKASSAKPARSGGVYERSRF